MSKLNFVQRVAQVVGVKSGPNTYFSPDISDPDNQCVYTSIEPVLVSKSLGLVEGKDLKNIVKARVNSFTTKRAI